MKRFICIGVFCLITVSLQAQFLKGKITDEKNFPLPNATVYIVEAHTGAITNNEGEFAIYLNSGNYTLHFQYMGYQTQTKTIKFPENNHLEIRLKPNKIELREVVINAKGEDPAYNIMRKAIAKGAYYEKIIPYSKSHVYIKGSFYLDKLPKIVKSEMSSVGIKEGDVYLKECVNEIIVIQGKTKQRIISENNSVPSLFDNTEDVLNMLENPLQNDPTVPLENDPL